MTKTLRHICGEIIHLDEQGNYHTRFDRVCRNHPISFCPFCKQTIEDGWFRPLYRIEPMSRGMMERTISGRYACSNCWGYGLLVQIVPPDEDGGESLYRVLCTECLEETVGFVSSGYIGHARERDYLNYLTVERTLGAEMGLKLPERRSVQDNLRALGFGL
jgi:hypothetical protein